MSLKKILLLSALVASTGGALAQTTGPLTLTLEEARRLARERNPAIAVVKESAAAARAGHAEAQAARLPTFSLSAAYARLSEVPPPQIETPELSVPVGPGTEMTVPSQTVTLGPAILNSYRLTASVAAPIFTGYRLSNRVEATRHLERAANQVVATEAADTHLDVDRRYWQLHSARAARRVLAESVRLVEAHLADVTRMKEVGLTTDDDVLEVRVKLSETKLREIQADHGAMMAEAALSNALSLPLVTSIALADSPAVVARQIPEQDSLERLARTNRPELLGLEERLQALDRLVAVARGERLPTVAAQADYEILNPNQRYFPTKDEFKDSWKIGVGVSWMAWDWGVVKQRTVKAQAEQRRAAEQMRQMREGVSLQILQSRLAVIEATSRTSVAEEGVRVAEAHHRNVRAKFSVGTAATTDVLDAETSLERARLDRIRAVVDQRVAWSALEHAVGILGGSGR